MSVINNNLWNKAKWSRATFASAGESSIPVFGLIFKDIESGRLIFENWRQLIGAIDENEMIRLSIVKGVDKGNPLKFVIHVTQSRESLRVQYGNRPFTQISRFKFFEPDSHENLDFFVREYERKGEYILAPIGITAQGLKPYLDHSLLKRKFYITDAWKVDSQHEDAPAIKNPENVLIPTGVSNPPIKDLLELKQRLRSEKS